MSSSHHKHDVVLVYAHDDAAVVEDLARTLSSAGVRIWFDRWELAPGHAWASAIGSAIDAANAIGFCIGRRVPGAPELDQVTAARKSNERGVPVVLPILLPGSDPSTIPAGLRDFHWIDLRHGLDAAPLDRLVAAIDVSKRLAPTDAETRGDARRAAGDFGGALEQYQRALAELGEQHEFAESVSLLAKLGATYADLGRYEDAGAVLSRAVSASDPMTDPDALVALGNLAETHRARGDLLLARQLQERVLEASTNMFGSEHPSTLTAMSNLAGVLRDAGDLDHSRAFQSRVLEARIRTWGPEHPSTLTAMSNLAGTLWDLGELEEARNLNEAILEARARTLGPNHPDTLTSKTNLAASLRAVGDVVRATRLNEDVYEGSRRTLGETHPVSLAAGANLAVSYLECGRSDEGAALLREVSTESERMLGIEHPTTLATQLNLALALRSTGEQAEADALLDALLVSSERTLGLRHPTTERVRRVRAAGAPQLRDVEGMIVLPIYLVADVSASMAPSLPTLNAGLQALLGTIIAEPILQDRTRLGLLTFSDHARWRMFATGMTSDTRLPQLRAEGGTNYGAAFRALREGLLRDMEALKQSAYRVYRPAVFFLTDGQPSDTDWRAALDELKRPDFRARPNIVAFGFDAAQAEILREVASRPDWALGAHPSLTPDRIIGGFMQSVTASVLDAGQTDDPARFTLFVPDEFEQAQEG